MRYSYASCARDIIEHVPTGRLYRLSSSDAPKLLLGGLMFANGVALAPDRSFVLVAETGRSRIQRYWLTGAEAGSADIFCELPGHPDNMSVGPDGLFWVVIASERLQLGWPGQRTQQVNSRPWQRRT